MAAGLRLRPNARPTLLALRHKRERDRVLVVVLREGFRQFVLLEFVHVLPEQAKLGDLVRVGADVVGDQVGPNHLFLVALGRGIPLAVDKLVARELLVLIGETVVGLEFGRVGHLHVLEVECLIRL